MPKPSPHCNSLLRQARSHSTTKTTQIIATTGRLFRPKQLRFNTLTASEPIRRGTDYAGLNRCTTQHIKERDMAKTVADLLIERLIEWGVDTVFGLPGDGINGIFEALRTNQERLKFIQVRHEEAAAFAACGYAKYTGRL